MNSLLSSFPCLVLKLSNSVLYMCTLKFTEVIPDSQSFRNLERWGSEAVFVSSVRYSHTPRVSWEEPELAVDRKGHRAVGMEILLTQSVQSYLFLLAREERLHGNTPKQSVSIKNMLVVFKEALPFSTVHTGLDKGSGCISRKNRSIKQSSVCYICLLLSHRTRQPREELFSQACVVCMCAMAHSVPPHGWLVGIPASLCNYGSSPGLSALHCWTPNKAAPVWLFTWPLSSASNLNTTLLSCKSALTSQTGEEAHVTG